VSPRGSKYLVLLAILAASGLVLLASTQTWYTLHLTTAADHPAPVVIPGSTASPALTALSLAGLALAGALAIGGRVARVVLGVLGILLSGCLVLSASLTIADPVASGISTVTTQTGVAGDNSVRHLVASVDSGVWPVVAVIGAVLMLLASVAVFITGRWWPTASRRYQTVRFAPADGSSDASSIEDLLDAESEGNESEDDDFHDDDPGAAGARESSHERTPDDPGAAKAAARDAAIDKWDDLSRGSDPTR
jgi:uncharacterized membrane protein (TIGR02234 family)